jgi:Xaa-Pro dipeptidase
MEGQMITKFEYLERINRLQKKVSENGLDAFIVSGEGSIYYLTGVSYFPLERPFFIIVKPGTLPVLLVPALEKVHLGQAPNIDKVYDYWDYPAPSSQGWSERLVQILDGVKKLGVEATLPLEIYGQLAAFTPLALPLVEELRLIKSPAEIEMIRQAAHYTDAGMQLMIKTAYYGVCEIELFSQARTVQMQIMKEVGYDALTTSVQTGAWPAPLSAHPHEFPSVSDRLWGGPNVAMSFMRVNGYAAECERTFFVAPPASRVKDAFADMTEARNKAFALLKPGVLCDEVDIAANGYLKEKGYGQYLLHRTGHGIGLGNHEGPWVAEASGQVLAENMVISIEPAIYIPDLGGVRHSDTVLITKDGYERLTHHPVDIKSLTITQSKPVNRLKGSIVRKALKFK